MDAADQDRDFDRFDRVALVTAFTILVGTVLFLGFRIQHSLDLQHQVGCNTYLASMASAGAALVSEGHTPSQTEKDRYENLTQHFMEQCPEIGIIYAIS